ncbi:MAG: cytochrome c3 family protein [Bryobacteraceae bacterium]|nr:cytochrome c3 family protein [Bryobacteraceae bacterium]
MAQHFTPLSNTLTRAFFVLVALTVGLVFWTLGAVNGSGYVTQQGVPREQPVQFSHEHHVAGLGIDCRYCHTTVEYAPSANIPPTKTCMNCHAGLWTVAPLLEPVRQSYTTGRPINWTRIHDLPDFVYFHHGIHVQKGIGCSECHGRVDRMPLMWQHASLTMAWCLDCHRNPELHVRPKDQVFNMAWVPPENRSEAGLKLVEQYGIERRTSCSTCHR